MPGIENNMDEVILLLTPSLNDSFVAGELLSRAGMNCQVCSNISDLCAQVRTNTGVIVIAEEGLSSDGISQLAACLDQQPPWSDLPIILLTSASERNKLNLWSTGVFGPRASVTLLERPFHTATLVSVVENALRARRRQFELKDLLEQHEKFYHMEQIARAEAERSNRAKDEFLATLSHELRTPLTTMLGWSKILHNKGLDETTVSRAIHAIELSAKSQAQLIDDLLDVSRIITGKFQIDKRSVDLVELTQSSLDMVRPAAEAKGIQIEAQMNENPGPITGDDHRLQQVLWNVLTNAIKFTPSGGLVRVELARTNSQASISITDTGKGIRPEFLPFIFERFRQSDSSYTRSQGGLGLGLAIAQHIVGLHGGTIHAESEGEGKGSRFIIQFPVTSTESTTFLNDPEKKKPGKLDLNLEGLKILLVEDDTECRDLIELILKNQKGNVRSANSVDTALAILKEWIPDIIISDIGMPGQDGYDLIAKLRSNPSIHHVPAIALTAYASRSDKARALEAGFQVHMAKPLDPMGLLEIVAGLSRPPK